MVENAEQMDRLDVFFGVAVLESDFRFITVDQVTIMLSTLMFTELEIEQRQYVFAGKSNA